MVCLTLVLPLNFVFGCCGNAAPSECAAMLLAFCATYIIHSRCMLLIAIADETDRAQFVDSLVHPATWSDEIDPLATGSHLR